MNRIYVLIFVLFSSCISLAQEIKSAEEQLSEIIVKGEIIARLDKNFDPEEVAASFPKNYDVKVDRILSRPTDIWLFKFDTTQINEQSLARQFYSVTGVVDAQINTLVELRSTPNDPAYGSQWWHQNIDSEEAWETTTGGNNAHGDDIVVCIIESAGVMQHPDLENNHWINTAEIPNNGIDDDGNGYVDDYNGWNVGSNNDNIGSGNHGTQVAGMIGAKGNNGIGIAGTNWDVKMMVVAGHNPNSQANIVECYTYPLEQRLLYNQTDGAEGAFVVATNASWGLDFQDAANYPIWCNFYDDLGEAGILNCGATTNQDANVDNVGDMPTGCESEYMVGVTATNQGDFKTFAGYGVNSVDIAAPGDGVFTTNNGGYGSTQGTSFASPLAAGVIGLLYSIPCPSFMNLVKSNPENAAQIVRDALYDGVDQTAHLENLVTTGGRVNANNSMEILLNTVCSGCLPPDDITTTAFKNAIEISFSEIDEAEQYKLFIREAGESDWNEFNISGLSFEFTGLESCTEYEIAVISECEEETSELSDVISVFTKDCGVCVDGEYCEPDATNPDTRLSIHTPESIASIIESDDFTVTNGWGADVNDGFNYGEMVLVDDGSSNAELGCGTLQNSDDIDGNIAVAVRGNCGFSVKAFRAQQAGATAMVIINNQTQSPGELGTGNFADNVEIPVVMIPQDKGAELLSELQSSNEITGLLGSQNEYIDEIIFENDTINTGDDGGFRDASFNHRAFSKGRDINFTLKPGFDGQTLPTYTRIWIDFDEDESFDDSELVYDQGSAEFGDVNASFKIPIEVPSIRTRMRVQMLYQGPDAAPLADACDDFTSGEVEDYCIEITGVVSDAEGDFIIFPNPAKEMVTVQDNLKEAKTIDFYDFSGKLVHSNEINSKTTEINLSHLAKGLYHVRILGKGEKVLQTSKLIVL